MDTLGILLFAALVQAPAASIAQPSIDFYFTHDAVLERGGAAAMTEWTAQCLAGGASADFARAYAPDLRMDDEERRAGAAKLDRGDLVRAPALDLKAMTAAPASEFIPPPQSR